MRSVLLEKKERLLEQAAVFKNNAGQIHELKKVLKALNANGIIPIILKGAYLSEKIYQDIGARFFNDVDILVRKQEFARAENILFGLGYGYTAPERAKEARQLGGQISFCKNNSVIDLHWDIVDLERFNRVCAINIEDFWQRSHEIEMFEGKIRELSVEDLMLYLLLHLSLQHCFQGRKLYQDIREVLLRMGDLINWQSVVERSKTYKVRRPVYFALFYARKDYAVAVPEDILARLKPHKNRILDWLIIRLLDKKIKPEHLDHLVMPCLLDTWKQRLTFIWGSPHGSFSYVSRSFHLIWRGLNAIIK
jgi:hypothetical protein